MKFSIDFLKNLPTQEKKLTLSTKFTILRFFLVPLVVFSIINCNWKMAFWLIFLSAITDILDGQIARARNEKTILGACLDPLADKFLILACYFSLIWAPVPFFSIPQWFVFVVFVKEILLVFGAIFFCSIKGWENVRPSILGKGAMVFNSIFIGILFLCYCFDLRPIHFLSLIFDLVIFLVLLSLVQYGTIGIRQIIFQKNL